MFGFGKKEKRIYMDFASKTPVCEEVVSAMQPFYGIEFSNPSALHREGLSAKKAVVESRKKIADILKSKDSEIFFISGGTEGNNLAIFGTFQSALKRGVVKPHIITSNVEHSSVLEVCKRIEELGGEVTYVPVSEDGLISPKDIFENIKDNTVLVSIMYSNNEIGTIQPIKEIGAKIKQWKEKKEKELTIKSNFPYFHTDACQSALYLSLDVSKLGVDMMTLDGIKMYGPSGVGIFYKKTDVEIEPVLYGGGQESGLRSGTENVPGIVGVAKALEIADMKRDEESRRLTFIRDYAIEKIISEFPKARLNGSEENRLPNNVNICFPDIDSEFIVVAMDVYGISASYSSSCKTLSENSSSYVIEALNKRECSMSSLRFSFGRETKKADIDFLLSILRKVIPLV